MEMTREAELGRKAKIAADFLKDYLTKRRNDLVMLLEDGTYSYGKDKDVLLDVLAEMRILSGFWREAEYFIQCGKIAEEELQKNGE